MNPAAIMDGIAERSQSALAPSILMVLNKAEWDFFFPEGFIPPEGFEDIKWKWKESPEFKKSPMAWRALLEQTSPEILISAWSTPPLPEEWVVGAGASLRYVCHLTGSVRRQVPRAFIERGGIVTNWGGMAARLVAEHALLLALSSFRRAPEWMCGGSQGASGIGCVETRTLFGARVGIHGCGGVARELARLLKAFTSDIACHAEGVPSEVIENADMIPVDSSAELFAGRDVLFECEALVPERIGCIDGNLLSLLPDGSLFVNVARGQLVNESALFAEIQSGRLRAALDVMAVEPVPSDSPWRDLPGVILSPHIAGPTLDQLPPIATHALEQVGRYLQGGVPEGSLTLEQYDRAT